jgi:hypothetical protein
MKKNQKIFVGIVFCLFIVAPLFLFSQTQYGIVLFKRLLNLNAFIFIGRDGWMFYRGELDYAILPWINVEKKLARLDAFAKQNNVPLIIVPFPNKIDLYPEKLDERLRGARGLRQKYSCLFAAMKRDNVNVVELLDNYEKAMPSVPIYDPDEAHVTTEGLEIAARETVRRFFSAFYADSSGCLGKKNVPFLSIMAGKQNDDAEKRHIDIYYNSCSDTLHPPDTILVIGDSYCNYLEKDKGSYADLLMCWLGKHYQLKRNYKVNAGFSQSGRIVELIKRHPHHKTIIWIFTAREFYKPLRLGL